MKRLIAVLTLLSLLCCGLCVPALAEEAEPLQFTDVSETAWYAEAVDYATANGLMQGVGNDRFDPNGLTSRAMVVTVLWRHNGAPAREFDGTFFLDLEADTWYSEAAEWAFVTEVVDGIPIDRPGWDDAPTGFSVNFAAERSITREQLAAILFRYANYLEADVTARAELSAFSDAASVSTWAEAAMQWCVAEGIIQGSSDNGALRLAPQDCATRAQVAAILMRFCETIKA